MAKAIFICLGLLLQSCWFLKCEVFVGKKLTDLPEIRQEFIDPPGEYAYGDATTSAQTKILENQGEVLKRVYTERISAASHLDFNHRLLQVAKFLLYYVRPERTEDVKCFIGSDLRMIVATSTLRGGSIHTIDKANSATLNTQLDLYMRILTYMRLLDEIKFCHPVLTFKDWAYAYKSKSDFFLHSLFNLYKFEAPISVQKLAPTHPLVAREVADARKRARGGPAPTVSHIISGSSCNIISFLRIVAEVEDIYKGQQMLNQTPFSTVLRYINADKPLSDVLTVLTDFEKPLPTWDDIENALRKTNSNVDEMEKKITNISHFVWLFTLLTAEEKSDIGRAQGGVEGMRQEIIKRALQLLGDNIKQTTKDLEGFKKKTDAIYEILKDGEVNLQSIIQETEKRKKEFREIRAAHPNAPAHETQRLINGSEKMIKDITSTLDKNRQEYIVAKENNEKIEKSIGSMKELYLIIIKAQK